MSRTLQWSAMLVFVGGCTFGTVATRPGARAEPPQNTAHPPAVDTTTTNPAVTGAPAGAPASDSGPGAVAQRLLARLARARRPAELDAIALPGRPTWHAARSALAQGRPAATGRTWTVEQATVQDSGRARVALSSGERRVLVHLSRVSGPWRIVEVTPLASRPSGPRAATSVVLTGADDSGSIGGGPGGGTLSVGLRVVVDGAPAVPASSTTLPRPYRIVATPSYDPSDPLAGLCPSPSGWSGFGWWWILDTVDRTSGAVVASRTQCVGLPGPGTIGPGPTPAQPPTVGEIWRQVALAPPTLGISPADRAVTGLDTRLWSSSPRTVGIDVAIGPWRAVGRAVYVGTAFDLGDGTVVYRSDGGDGAHPSVHHVYERTGTQRLQVAAAWRATVTLSGPGLPTRTTPIGTALLSVAGDYPVDEVRSVLVG